MKRDIITVENITVQGIHGYYDSEKMTPQEFVVTVTCELTKELNSSDELTETVNYEDLRVVVMNHIGGEHRKLLETLAVMISHDILIIPYVYGVTVCIKKTVIWDDAVPVVTIYRHH